MKAMLELGSNEAAGGGRRPDATVPTARQGCLTSRSLSIGRKWGFTCVYANTFFYPIKLLTGTAGMLSVHTGKSAPKC